MLFPKIPPISIFSQFDVTIIQYFVFSHCFLITVNCISYRSLTSNDVLLVSYGMDDENYSPDDCTGLIRSRSKTKCIIHYKEIKFSKRLTRVTAARYNERLNIKTCREQLGDIFIHDQCSKIPTSYLTKMTCSIIASVMQILQEVVASSRKGCLWQKYSQTDKALREHTAVGSWTMLEDSLPLLVLQRW